MNSNNFRDLLMTFIGLFIVIDVTFKLKKFNKKNYFKIFLLILGGSIVFLGAFINISYIIKQALSMLIIIPIYIIWLFYCIYFVILKSEK
ncbi:hypothetical protein [Clostridium hydrogenum]|uniref:hypothetical protein n=1 Tax=Clostridium hydrogenum TaxID=2855764 RepID=UPI001F1B855A|nr:hypothetical protein [Clostridium hydrogenum]